MQLQPVWRYAFLILSVWKDLLHKTARKFVYDTSQWALTVPRTMCLRICHLSQDHLGLQNTIWPSCLPSKIAIGISGMLKSKRAVLF